MLRFWEAGEQGVGGVGTYGQEGVGLRKQGRRLGTLATASRHDDGCNDQYEGQSYSHVLFMNGAMMGTLVLLVNEKRKILL